MSEFRQDLETGSWVIIAPERLKGKAFEELKNPLRDNLPEYEYSCPFCPQNEERFENIELMKIPHPDKNNPHKSEWLARVVENKFKVYGKKNSKKTSAKGFEVDGIYHKVSAQGEHVLVVESCQHNKTFANMKPHEVEAVIKLYTDMFNKLREDPKNLLTVIFKNHGVRSGASQVHPHSQIVSMGVVPNYIRFLLEEAQRYFDTNGRCVFCAVSEFELKNKKRVVYENKQFFSYIPYAAYVPYQITILPKRHDSLFGDMPEKEIEDFADCLRITMRKLYLGLSNPDFNFIMRNPPYPLSNVPYYHWYVEIVPHILMQGGFELGSRVNVNVVPPEKAAAHLRRIKI